MLKWMAAALMIGAFAPSAQAETAKGDPALQAAMKSFFVVVAADQETGNPIAEVRASVDGSQQRTLVVAFIDAADAAAEMASSGVGATSIGRLVNGAELIGLSGGEVIWRTSAANAGLVNAQPTTPPAFYITNADGESLTQTIDGQEKVLFYLDAVVADEARVAVQNRLSAARQPSNLSVVAADFMGLVDGVRTGAVKNAYFVSSPSVVRWADQWESGARLIKDYKADAN